MNESTMEHGFSKTVKLPLWLLNFYHCIEGNWRCGWGFLFKATQHRVIDNIKIRGPRRIGSWLNCATSIHKISWNNFFFFYHTMQHMGYSPHSDQTKASCRPPWTLQYWTTREVTEKKIFKCFQSICHMGKWPRYTVKWKGLKTT